MPFLLKHKMDPVTGKKMTTKDVITLEMDKDEEGQWQCPVLTKPFSDHTKIVAIRHGNQANVYSWQAYHELNLRTKNMEDLISGEKFTKKDVIVLNDPDNEEFNRLRDINNFHHILHARSLDVSKPTTNVRHSVTATRIMEKLQQQKAKSGHKNSQTKPDDNGAAAEPKLKIFSDAVTGVAMTSGKTSGSLTSTSMDVSNSNDTREATQEEVLKSQFALMRKRKRKGFVTLSTNLGDIGLELHCDIAPRTCTNFLGLADAGAYDGTKFHRLIKNFMIQGGKAKKGEEDESLWGGAFVDEFDDRLKHKGEGILSMANAGQNTNKRQFFITFADAPHLDRKHSVFGRVVDGLKVLHEMRKVPTDKRDRPVHELKIEKVEVLVNPAKDAEDLERKRLEEVMESKRQQELAWKESTLGKRKGSNSSNPRTAASPSAQRSKTEIGKYLKKTNSQKSTSGTQADPEPRVSRLPPPPKKTKFGNFSGW